MLLMPRLMMMPFVVLMASAAPQAQGQSSQDRWGLTDKHWRASTDLEILRASEIALRCQKVNAISETASDVRSRMILAIALRHNVCMAKDAARLERIIAAAAAAGEARAIHDLAVSKGAKGLRLEQAKEVWALVGQAASLGDARAKAAQAVAYADGVPGVVTKDFNHALKLFGDAGRAGFWPVAFLMDSSAGEGKSPWSAAEHLAMLKVAAENQNYSAMAVLAQHLEKGDLGPADKAGAAFWRGKIAQRGGNVNNDAEIADALSSMAIEWKVKESSSERLARLEASAAAGDAEALYQLGQTYEYPGDDIGIREDKAKALAYYVSAARKGHQLAPYGAATYLWDKKSPLFNEVAGIALFREAGKTSGEAKRKLASYLAYQSIKFRSPAEAVRLFREAIAADEPFAMVELATLLEGPLEEDPAWEMVKNTAEAIGLYKRYLATDFGKKDGDAMAALADLLVRTEPSASTSPFPWAERAAALDSARGNQVLGDILFWGSAGQPYDFVRARKHWAKAAELDSRYDMTDRIAMVDSALAENVQTKTAAAMASLGLKYYNGDDRPLDWVKAKSWLLGAVAAGSTNRSAIYTLGELQEEDKQYREAAASYGRLTSGNDDIASISRKNVARLQASGFISRPTLSAAPAPRAATRPKPAPSPQIANSSVASTRGQGGAPTARQIRDALVYENTFGRVTVGDAMGLAKRQADYEAGISRVTVMGMVFDVSFGVSNPQCSRLAKGSFSCRYRVTMNNSMGIPYSGPGSHTFEMRNGIWRSPTYLKAIIASGNRSAAGANNGKNCTVQGFGTAEGASIRDAQGLPC